MHSEICPVCQGEGKVRDKISNEKKPCHGCNGRGWVEVQDNGTTYWPIYPQPYVPPYDPYPYTPPYVPAPFDPGPWVCEYDQTAAEDKLWRDRVWT